ncbi:MAG: hypothetical protein V1692_02590, partial [bacterium]
MAPSASAANPVIEITQTAATRRSNVIIRYTLSDADGNTPCGLSVAYATSNNAYATWATATRATDTVDSGITPACVVGAATYTFAWDADGDLANWQGYVKIRLSVTDAGLESANDVSDIFEYENITSRPQRGPVLPIHGNPSDWQAKISASVIEYTGRLVGVENAELGKVFREINGQMTEVASFNVFSDLKQTYSFSESGLEPNTTYKYFIQLNNSVNKTPLY